LQSAAVMRAHVLSACRVAVKRGALPSLCFGAGYAYRHADDFDESRWQLVPIWSAEAVVSLGEGVDSFHQEVLGPMESLVWWRGAELRLLLATSSAAVALGAESERLSKIVRKDILHRTKQGLQSSDLGILILSTEDEFVFAGADGIRLACTLLQSSREVDNGILALAGLRLARRSKIAAEETQALWKAWGSLPAGWLKGICDESEKGWAADLASEIQEFLASKSAVPPQIRDGVVRAWEPQPARMPLPCVPSAPAAGSVPWGKIGAGILVVGLAVFLLKDDCISLKSFRIPPKAEDVAAAAASAEDAAALQALTDAAGELLKGDVSSLTPEFAGPETFRG